MYGWGVCMLFSAIIPARVHTNIRSPSYFEWLLAFTPTTFFFNFNLMFYYHILLAYHL